MTPDGAVGAERIDRLHHQSALRLLVGMRAAVESGRVEELGAIQQLALRQRAPVVAEQHRRSQPDGRERRGRVDARGDAQAELLDDLLLFLARAGLGIDAALAEESRQRDGLVDPDGDAPIAAAQDAGRSQQRFCVFLLLLAAEQFVLVAARFDDLFVAQADGREVRVGPDAGEPGIHFQRQHAELRRQELAGSRAAAFDEELLGEAVL